MQTIPGAVIAGKYRLERPLARGGMGAVWVAQHVALGARLAVKFLDPRFATSPALAARFEREARAAATLETPHVVRVQDFGVDEGVAYLVMELLHGEDLGERLRRVGRLSLPESLRILSQAAKAVRRAHDAGLIHRDLKPGNLFMARVEDEEIVKVLDFGIAKERWSTVGEATKTGEVFGSPHYMSPEQARADKDIDHRSDVWSLGVIAYRMLTGHLPFPGEVLGSVMSKVLVEPPQPLGDVAPDLPAELEPFFAKAMAKKKDERFSSVIELVAAFADIVERVGFRAPGQRSSVPVETVASKQEPGAAGDGTALVGPRAESTEVLASAPTQVLSRATPPPLPHAEEQHDLARSTTGPSLVASTTTHAPGGNRPSKRWIAWIAGALAITCTVALGIQRVIGTAERPHATSPPVSHEETAVATAQSPEPLATSTATITVEPAAKESASSSPLPGAPASAPAAATNPEPGAPATGTTSTMAVKVPASAPSSRAAQTAGVPPSPGPGTTKSSSSKNKDEFGF